jgi:hypothetical protein
MTNKHVNTVTITLDEYVAMKELNKRYYNVHEAYNLLRRVTNTFNSIHIKREEATNLINTIALFLRDSETSTDE